MNKKGEALTIAMFLLLVLVIGIVYYEGKIEDKNYIGDNSKKIAYNLKSKNKDCNIEQIKIEREDIKLFDSREQAISQNFKISEKCPYISEATHTTDK